MEEAFEEKDSRERLEKEVQHYYIWYTDRKRIIEWLDRQAAITEQETKLRELYKFEENHRWHVRTLEETIQELSERIDALTKLVKEHERKRMEPDGKEQDDDERKASD